MFSEYLLSDWGEKGGGSGGGGGGSDDNGGCGIIAVIFLVCLALSTQCNGARMNENNFRSSNPQIEIVEEVDCVTMNRSR